MFIIKKVILQKRIFSRYERLHNGKMGFYNHIYKNWGLLSLVFMRW